MVSALDGGDDFVGVGARIDDDSLMPCRRLACGRDIRNPQSDSSVRFYPLGAQILDERSDPKYQKSENDEADKYHSHHHSARHCRHIHHLKFLLRCGSLRFRALAWRRAEPIVYPLYWSRTNRVRGLSTPHHLTDDRRLCLRWEVTHPGDALQHQSMRTRRAYVPPVRHALPEFAADMDDQAKGCHEGRSTN
jgi:hypothetical protein